MRDQDQYKRLGEMITKAVEDLAHHMLRNVDHVWLYDDNPESIEDVIDGIEEFDQVGVELSPNAVTGMYFYLDNWIDQVQAEMERLNESKE